jgi:hypothetical protein
MAGDVRRLYARALDSGADTKIGWRCLGRGSIFMALFGLYMLASSSKNTIIALTHDGAPILNILVVSLASTLPSLPLLGVDIAPCANLDPPASRVSGTTENAR